MYADWPLGYKTFFVPDSAEHEIERLISIKITRNSAFFSGSDKPIMLFFLLIDDKMPTIVGILTYMSGENFMLS